MLNSNYELEEKNKSLEAKIDVLKSFILQNDESYRYNELQMIF